MKLYKHQQEALDAAVPALQNPGSRAVVSMACGTGKTLVSIKSVEMILNSDPNAKIIVFAPTLALIDQLMTNFVRHNIFGNQFCMLPVASSGSSLYGEDVIDSLKGVDPKVLAKKSALPTILPNTTDAKEIANALQSKGRTIVFCTYQSSGAVQKATRLIARNNPNFSFDMAVMDEAHRTAGGGKEEDSSYLMCLTDSVIAIKRRLFVTATPKIRTVANSHEAINGRDSSAPLSDRFYEYGFSMDDKSIYGEIVYKYSFASAISDGMLADLRLYAVMISDTDMRTAVARDSNIAISDVKLGEPNSGSYKSAKNLALAAAVARLFEQGKVTAGISFHQNIGSSKEFADNAGGFLRHSEGEDLSEAFIAHVDGTTPQRERVSVMNNFMDAQNDGKLAILSNVQLYTEGVDVPQMNTVIFADNKTSTVSIVQAAGRAVRLDPKNPTKLAAIIVPVFIGSSDDPHEAITRSKFETLYKVIAALRESDNMADLYVRSIMRETLREVGITAPSDLSLIHTVDADGNDISASEGGTDVVDGAINFVAPASAGSAHEMTATITESYRKFAATCEARIIGSNYSVFERNLGKLRAYKEKHGTCAAFGHDELFGNFAIGKEMAKVSDAFLAGILPENERAAYEAEGFELTHIDELADELLELAASFAS